MIMQANMDDDLLSIAPEVCGQLTPGGLCLPEAMQLDAAFVCVIPVTDLQGILMSIIQPSESIPQGASVSTVRVDVDAYTDDPMVFMRSKFPSDIIGHAAGGRRRPRASECSPGRDGWRSVKLESAGQFGLWRVAVAYALAAYAMQLNVNLYIENEEIGVPGTVAVYWDLLLQLVAQRPQHGDAPRDTVSIQEVLNWWHQFHIHVSAG